jgi:hypothetical protein
LVVTAQIGSRRPALLDTEVGVESMWQQKMGEMKVAKQSRGRRAIDQHAHIAMASIPRTC